MSNGRDFAKMKRKRRAKFGERVDRNTRGTGPSREWRNLRTEWDGEPFPVEVRKIEVQTSDA